MFSAKRPFLRPSIFFILLTTWLLTSCAVNAENQNWPGLSTDGETVYVAFGGGVAAYDPVENEEKWLYRPENRALLIYSPPSVQDGRVIFGDYGAAGGMFSPTIIVSIYGKEENGNDTPNALWTNNTAATDKIVAGPLQVGGVAYVSTTDYHVLALDAASGDEEWRFTADGPVWSQPTYYEETLYITSLDKHVYALNANTGEELWQTELGGAISAQAIANPDENLLYVGSYDNTMHALDMATGEEKWSAATTNWIWSAPALTDGTLYFADSDGNIYALDAITGEAKWQQSVNELREDEVLENKEGAVQASPVVANGKVYIAGAGNIDTKEGLLLVLDAQTGEAVWQCSTRAPLFTTPVIAGNHIVVAMSGELALLAAYDLETGGEDCDPNVYLPVLE